MQWKPFIHGAIIYDLTHLHPFSFDLVVEASGGKPARSYRLNTEFSLLCFSRSPRAGEAISTDLAYSDSRETRIFDADRYEQSKLLPQIVRSLAERPCFHDTHGNFYVFEIVKADGTISYYSVFFTLSKAGKKAGRNLFISSAHMRPDRPYAHSVKPIRFRILVHNVWTKKGVTPAP
ncbi:hypothetical protein [Mesorhizobium carmichaelinearum]|uniref:hypothetical protein n=1 Tax=Mesorhizobium carmichaelinearum TaxID=1208188 RepID=UPI000BA4D93A|nr:hypothetical protein [Mesorhizobium carmichaelinearum]